MGAGDAGAAALTQMRAEAQLLMNEICAYCAVAQNGSFGVMVPGANGQFIPYPVIGGPKPPQILPTKNSSTPGQHRACVCR